MLLTFMYNNIKFSNINNMKGEPMNNNQKALTIIILLLIMCTGISISYAFFKVSSSNNKANTSVTVNGANLCMSLQLTSNNITIANEYAVPISDSKALSSNTYKTSVTIKNNCSTSQSFGLLLVPSSVNTMPIKALKYTLVEKDVTPTSGSLIRFEYALSSGIRKQLLELKNDTVTTGFSVGNGSISSGLTKTYDLYIWIDRDEGSLGSGVTMDKTLNAYLTLSTGTNVGNEKTNLYQTIKNRYDSDKTYISLYNGEGASNYNNNVYYFKGDVKDNNVLFAGFCWKIVRTTDTGGTKIIYNGRPKTLEEGISCDNTKESSQIGTSAFNSSSDSPAYVGYMYNTVYKGITKSMTSLSNIVFANSFTYNNGVYTLSDTKTIASWSTGYNEINNYHYTMFTTTNGSSEKIYYVYFADSNNAYYIELSNGITETTALNEMLSSDDVNKTDSTIKTVVDSWYVNNLKKYGHFLEDTEFCNDRSVSNLYGWNPNNGDITKTLQFNNYAVKTSLYCKNETDRFSQKNSKAKLTYPIGLLTVPEANIARNNSKTNYLNNDTYYWLSTPFYYGENGAIGWSFVSGGWGSYSISTKYGVRPVVSIRPEIGISSGDGSYTSPYIIE